MTIIEIYDQSTDLKKSCTWHMGRLNTAKRSISQLEYRKLKAKSYDKEFWQKKIDSTKKEIETCESELEKSLKKLRNFLNDSL